MIDHTPDKLLHFRRQGLTRSQALKFLAKTRKLQGLTPWRDAVTQLVKFRAPVAPNPAWRQAYREGLHAFIRLISDRNGR